MKIEKEMVVLQYPPAGTPTSSHPYTDGTYPVVSEDDAGKFVALDSASGGYPYPTELEDAHNFRTVEQAESYQRSFPMFLVRKAKVTYTVVE